MKVLAINGSPKKEGNTYHAIRAVALELEKEGIEVEILHIGNKQIGGCLACNRCVKNRDEKCAMDKDCVNDAIQKMKEADGIILGSPVYFSAIAGNMKSFLDRVFYVASVNNSLFRHKVGVPVVAVRRSGGVPTFNQLNNFINYGEMLMPTSNYWAVAHGTRPGEVLQDEEGIQIMSVMGQNMSWLLKILDHSKDAITPPNLERKIYTNFIRK